MGGAAIGGPEAYCCTAKTSSYVIPEHTRNLCNTKLPSRIFVETKLQSFAAQVPETSSKIIEELIYWSTIFISVARHLLSHITHTYHHTPQ